MSLAISLATHFPPHRPPPFFHPNSVTRSLPVLLSVFLTLLILLASQLTLYTSPPSPLLLHPYTRYLPPDSPDLSYPLLPSTISTTLLFLLVFLGGTTTILLTIALYSIRLNRGTTKQVHDFSKEESSVLVALEQQQGPGERGTSASWARTVEWKRVAIRYRPAVDAAIGLISFLSTIALTTLATDAGKVYCGRPRPDYYARLADVGPGEGGADSALLRDGVMSFPSGHASLSFATATYVTLFMASRTGALSQTKVTSPLVAAVLAVPMVLAYFIAMSRTRDYHHNFVDVLAGAVIGSVCAATVHGYWYRFPWQPYPAFPKALWEPSPDDDAHISNRLRMH